ncbi:copper transport protein ATOX1 [Xenopus laevis]|nr:copper transport protein ATOX1 [Xenopus laevis]
MGQETGLGLIRVSLPAGRAELYNRDHNAAVTMPKEEFFVDMTCEGCSNAVNRVLSRLQGVQYEIDLPNKKVVIESDLAVDLLLETLKKTGKEAKYLGCK